MTSTLYLCANHIGQLKDLPPRTIEILQLADVVLCEDTRSAGRLMSALGLRKTLTSYFNFNEEKRTEELRTRLANEELQIALISESGMPLISDPGYRIVGLFHELGLPIETIPGPSAFVTALIMSGFPLQRFQYVGFWPIKKGQQTKLLNEVALAGYPFVFYESPHRILKSVTEIAAQKPELQVFVVKELTKPYETYWRGTAVDVANQLKDATLKGEFTVVLYHTS